MGGFLCYDALIIIAAAAIARYKPDNKQNKKYDGEDYKCGEICKNYSCKYGTEDKS